jgi:hypothetical protein
VGSRDDFINGRDASALLSTTTITIMASKKSKKMSKKMSKKVREEELLAEELNGMRKEMCRIERPFPNDQDRFIC